MENNQTENTINHHQVHESCTSGTMGSYPTKPRYTYYGSDAGKVTVQSSASSSWLYNKSDNHHPSSKSQLSVFSLPLLSVLFHCLVFLLQLPESCSQTGPFRPDLNHSPTHLPAIRNAPHIPAHAPRTKKWGILSCTLNILSTGAQHNPADAMHTWRKVQSLRTKGTGSQLPILAFTLEIVWKKSLISSSLACTSSHAPQKLHQRYDFCTWGIELDHFLHPSLFFYAFILYFYVFLQIKSNTFFIQPLYKESSEFYQIFNYLWVKIHSTLHYLFYPLSQVTFLQSGQFLTLRRKWQTG